MDLFVSYPADVSGSLLNQGGLEVGNEISFPGLGITLDPSEIAFSVFGLNIRWYGIIIATGFMLAFLYGLKRCEKFGFNQDQLVDMLFVAVPVAIIGARAYYVIFNYHEFAYNPAQIFKIWTGGLAIYGAVIGGLLSGAIAARVKGIKIGAALDLGSLGFLIGQAVGRWGNFINREAYGSPTNLPWRMEIYDRAARMRIAVHPTFLYEFLWNVLGFVLLHFASKRRRYDGQIFLTYVAWYGLGRGLIEGLRTDSLYLFDTGLRVSQVLGFGSCLVALLILGYNALFRRFDPEDLQYARYMRLFRSGNDLAGQSVEPAGEESENTGTDIEDDIAGTDTANDTNSADTDIKSDPDGESP